MEIQNSKTERVLNQKGEWGSNLPPTQTTTVRGEIYTHEDENKGRKRLGGRPPEPPDPPEGGDNDFEGQFRQRSKRRKVELKRLRIQSAPKV